MTRILVIATISALAGGAVMTAHPAAAGDVHVGINVGVPVPPPPPPPPPLVLAAPPRLVIVPGSPVRYAPEVTINFFAYGGHFYTLRDGAWFVARSHRGPWVFVAPRLVPRPVLAVPGRYYRVPPGHAHHHHGHPPSRGWRGPRGPEGHPGHPGGHHRGRP